MSITLEEARTLDAFARCGSIAQTAARLRKVSSAVVYALASIESKAGIKILDRSGYRTRLLPAGERVLEGCRALLEREAELALLCSELASGWEPDLRVIVDGVVPMRPIFESLRSVSRQGSTSRAHVYTEFLGGVEERFLASGADFMISVLAPERTALQTVPLAPIPMQLLAHSRHPLVARPGTRKTSDLLAHSCITVRGSDPRLALSTGVVEGQAAIELNDFHSKKLAVLSGLGYGWLPESLVSDELRRGTLVPLRWEGSSRHVLKPHLYHRGLNRLGKSGKAFLKELRHRSRSAAE